MLFRVVFLNALTLVAAAEACAKPHQACDPGGSGFKKIDCCPGSTCYRQEPAGEGGSYSCLGSYQLAIEDEHRFPVEEAAEMVLADAGACTADDAIKSSTVKFSCDAVKCAKSNFFKLDPTAACITKEDGVSSGCANCFGQVSQCVVKNCAVKCLVDPTAPACQACGHAACDDLAKSCTGLATLPPDAKDCPKAEVEEAAEMVLADAPFVDSEKCAKPHQACDPGNDDDDDDDDGFKKIPCCPGSTCYRQEPAGEGGSYICLGSYQLAVEDEHRFPVLAAAEPACKDAFPPRQCDMACFQRCCATRGGADCIVHSCGCTDVTSLSCSCPQEEGMTLEQAKANLLVV